MDDKSINNPLEILRKVVLKYLHYSPDDVLALDYVVIVVLNGIVNPIVDKFWGYLIGPASAGKTELVRIFQGHPKIKYVDDLTTNAYVSGTVDEKGNDPSLLAVLHGKTLICKDLAAARSGDGITLNKFQGQLRGAHDNFFCKHSGMHGGRSYDSRHGLLVCTTPLPDSLQRLDQQIGERKYNFYMNRINPTHQQVRIQGRAVANFCTHKDENRQEIVEMACKCLDEAYIFALRHWPDWILPDEIEEWLFNLSYLACRVRTTSVEGHQAFAELPGRMYSVLNSAAACYSFWHNQTSWMDSCKTFLSRIVLDTLLPSTREILLGIWLANSKDTRWANLEVLRQNCGGRFPDDIIVTTLREFEEMKLLYKKPGTYEIHDYILTKFTDNLLEKSGLLEATPLPSLYRRQNTWPYNIAISEEAQLSQQITF